MSIQVTLIGGPADLQRHTVPNYVPYLYVADACKPVQSFNLIGECTPIGDAVPVYRHRYAIQRLVNGYEDFYVALYEGSM